MSRWKFRAVAAWEFPYTEKVKKDPVQSIEPRKKNHITFHYTGWLIGTHLANGP